MNEEMREMHRLQLRHMRIQTAILAVILVVCLVSAFFLTTRVSGMVRQVESIHPESLAEAVDSMKLAAEALGNADMDAVNDGIRALSEAADHLSDLDVDRINSLIGSLNSVAGQMEATSNAFSRLFGK